MSKAMEESPPIPHITQNYVPLRSLFLAVCEKCGKELANVLRTSENLFSNMARKEQFLKFVVAARQEYVKLYVLCKWAMVYQNISRAIDVTNWLHGQVNCFNNVVTALYHLQAGLAPAKSPYADIETALEVLKYGCPTPTPEAALFLPHRKLSDTEVLRVLRRLDVLIAMRLALHEHLPQHYFSYTVGNGRARFTVGCLWVELSIADEDVANQSRFFYVDCGTVENHVSGDKNSSAGDQHAKLAHDDDDESSFMSPKFKMRMEHALNELLFKRSLVHALDWVSMLSAVYKLQLLDKQLKLAEDRSESWNNVIKHQLGTHLGTTQLRIQIFINTPAPAEAVISMTKSAPYSLVTAEDYHLDLNNSCFVSSKSFINQLLSQISRFHAAKKLEGVSAPWITRVNEFCVSFLCSPTRAVELSVDPTNGLFALNGNGPLFADIQQKLNTQSNIARSPESIVEAISRLRAKVSMDTLATRAEVAGWRAQQNVRLAPDEQAKIKPAQYLLALKLPNDFSGWSLCAAFGGKTEPHWFASRVQCEQRRWVLGPIHEIGDETINLKSNENTIESTLNDPDYAQFTELAKTYQTQFVLYELMRELARQKVRHELRVRGGERVVVADINQILPGASWAQSGLVCSVSDGFVRMEGRSKPDLLHALGEISQSGPNAIIEVDGIGGKFIVKTPQVPGCQLYLQYIRSALGHLHYAANSLTSVTSLGLEVRSATLSSLEIKYIAPHGVLEVQNNTTIIFGDQNPQRGLAPFLPSIDEHSKSSLVRIVTFLREWYPVWEYFTTVQTEQRCFLLPQSINKLHVQFGSKLDTPFIEITLRNFRRQHSVNFLTAGNGAEQHELVQKFFSERVYDGVVPLVSGCAIDIGCEKVMHEIVHALSNKN